MLWQRVRGDTCCLTLQLAAYTLIARVPTFAPPSRCAALRMQEDSPPEPALVPEESVPEDSAAPADVPPPTETADVPPPAETADVPPPTETAEDEFDWDEGSVAKEALKSEIGDGLLGTRPDAAVIGEILLALEAANPTRSPATSPLLNGKWKVVYASGTSPGLKAFTLLLKGAQNAPKSPSGAELVDVQDAYITIQAEQPRAESSVKTRVFSFENTVKLTSRIEAESAVRLVETYDSAESSYMNLRLPFQSPLQYKRSLLVSYLDEELLIIRDRFGRPDVLMRCDDSFWATSASSDAEAADDAAPGAS